METTHESIKSYHSAWKARSYEEMMNLISMHHSVEKEMKSEERRVFSWMHQAERMGDVAINVLSFWLVED